MQDSGGSLASAVKTFSLAEPFEQITASGGGLLAKPFDINELAEKVLTLVQDAELSKSLGLKGRKWVEKKLTPEAYAKELARVYDKALKDSS